MKLRRPFGRRGPAARPGPDSPVESALRHSLASNAMDAPPADDLAQRILAAVDDSSDPAGVAHRSGTTERAPRGPVPSRSPRWKSAGLPLVAAAVVAAIVAIGVGVAAYHPDHDTGSNRAATDAPSATHAVQTPTVTPSTAAPTSTVPSKGSSGLTDVKILDLTFFGENDGVALGSAQCAGGSGRCLAYLTTTDGTVWKAQGGSFGFDVPGITAGCPASKCVEHIRFANDHRGFAYGPDAFYTTDDGGRSWQPRPGGAVALESLGGNVIRVRTTSSGRFEVQTAGIGDNTWTTADLGGNPEGAGVQLARGGTNHEDAYVLVTRNPAGRAGSATSTLYRSTDDGMTWNNRGEPCTQTDGEVDSYQVSAGLDGNVTVLCRDRAGGPFRVAVSTDDGADFTTKSGTIAASDVAATATAGSAALRTVLAGGPSSVLGVAGRSVFLSTNGGESWDQAADLVGTFSFLGFQSTKTARAVSSDGSEIWTTHNAGRTWHRSHP